LLEGVGAAALHPIIHLSYGIEADCDPEICGGLAHLCYAFVSHGKIERKDEPFDCSTLPLPAHFFGSHPKELSAYDISKDEAEEDYAPVDPSETGVDPFQELAKVRADTAFDDVKCGAKFQDKMDFLAKDKQTYVNKYDLPFADKSLAQLAPLLPKVVRQLTDVVLRLFAGTGSRDFFLLHAVTSCRGMDRALPYLDPSDQVRGLMYYWRAIVCVYIAQCRLQPEPEKETGAEKGGASKRSRSKPKQEMDVTTWDTVIPEILQINEEHLIKLAFVLRRQDSNLGLWPLRAKTAHTAHKEVCTKGFVYREGEESQ
jgi:hypothetical protein